MPCSPSRQPVFTHGRIRYTLATMEFSDLPVTHQAAIPSDYMDEMGHMNVTWYTYLFDQATWQFFASLGMSLQYFAEQEAGAFALENHTRYLAEVRLGQRVAIRTRAIGRSSKRFHFMHFMVIEGSGLLAATAEFVGMHIDRRTRRSSPLPDSIAASFDLLIAEHRQLSWDPPLCGVMHP